MSPTNALRTQLATPAVWSELSCESQHLEFATDRALTEYQNDPDRLARSAMLDHAIERMEVIRVRHVSAPG